MSRIRSVPLRCTVVVTAAVGLVDPAALGGGAVASHTDPGSPATTRVSITSSGDQVGAPSFDSDISAGGRYVAFSSDSSRLVAGDTNGVGDIFVGDLVANVTRRVSLGPGDVQANNSSVDPAISADGQYVAFQSSASNLVAGDTNGTVGRVRSEPDGQDDPPCVGRSGRR